MFKLCTHSPPPPLHQACWTLMPVETMFPLPSPLKIPAYIPNIMNMYMYVCRPNVLLFEVEHYVVVESG